MFKKYPKWNWTETILINSIVTLIGKEAGTGRKLWAKEIVHNYLVIFGRTANQYTEYLKVEILKWFYLYCIELGRCISCQGYQATGISPWKNKHTYKGEDKKESLGRWIYLMTQDELRLPKIYRSGCENFHICMLMYASILTCLCLRTCIYITIFCRKGHKTKTFKCQGPCLVVPPTKEMVNDSSNPTGWKL